MTKEAFLVGMVLLLLLIFFFWNPRSSALKWCGLVATFFVAMAAFSYIPD